MTPFEVQSVMDRITALWPKSGWTPERSAAFARAITNLPITAEQACLALDDEAVRSKWATPDSKALHDRLTKLAYGAPKGPGVSDGKTLSFAEQCRQRFKMGRDVPPPVCVAQHYRAVARTLVARARANRLSDQCDYAGQERAACVRDCAKAGASAEYAERLAGWALEPWADHVTMNAEAP